MKCLSNLEFRKYEENEYDFTDAQGQRQAGTSKSLVFINDDEKLIRITVPKDCADKFDNLKKGYSYDVRYDLRLKPVVDKSNNPSDKQFFAYFSLIEVIPFANTPKESK